MAIELGELILSVRADAADLYQQMGQYRTDIAAFGQEAEAMLSGIKLKAVDLPTIKPTVDHAPLHDLNRHIDKKVSHVKDANRFFQANPLKPMVDYSELKKLENLLNLSSGRSFISAKVSTDRASSNKRDMGDRIVQGFQDSIRGVGKDFADNVSKAVKAAIPKEGPLDTIGRSLIQGAFEPVTAKFGQGLQKGIDQALGSAIGSTELLGESLSKGLLTSGPEISRVLNELFDAAIEDLPSSARNSLEQLKDDLTSAFSDQFKEIADSVQGGLSSIIGDDQILRESLSVQGRSRSAISGRLDPARREIAEQRRERFRDVESRQSELSQARQAVSQQESRIGNAETLLKQIEQGIEQAEFDIQVAEPADVERLNEQLRSSREEFKVLTQWISRANESLADLQSQIEPAEKSFNDSKEALKKVDAQFKSLGSDTMPRIFREALSAITGGMGIADSAIPRLVVDEQTLGNRGSKATFDIDTNSILVTQEMKDALDTGMATAEQIQTVLHELQHAFDFDFGSFEGIEAIQRMELLRPSEAAVPTPAEADQLSGFLQQYDPQLREIEQNAELNARRLASNLVPQVEARREGARLESVAGVGGDRIKDEFRSSLQIAFQQITELRKLADGLNIDPSQIEMVQKNLAGLIPEIQAINVDDVRTRGDASEVLESIRPVLAIVDEIQSISAQVSKAQISPRIAKVLPSLFSQIKELSESVGAEGLDVSALDSLSDNLKTLVKKAAELQADAISSIGTDDFDPSKIDQFFSVFTILADKVSNISLLPEFEGEAQGIVEQVQALEELGQSLGTDFAAVSQAKEQVEKLFSQTVDDQELALNSGIKPSDLQKLNERLSARVENLAQISEALGQVEQTLGKLKEIDSASTDLSALQERVEFIGGDTDAINRRITDVQGVNDRLGQRVLNDANLPLGQNPSNPVGDDVLMALNDAIATLQSDADALLGPEFKVPLEFGEQFESVLADFGEAAVNTAKKTVSAMSQAIIRTGNDAAQTVSAIATSEEAKEFAFKAGQAAQKTVKGIADQATALGDGNQFSLPGTSAIVPTSSGGLIQGAKEAGGFLIASGMKAADAIEFAAFSLVPGGAMAREPIKGGIRNVALPAATFAAATQIPGMAPIADFATGGMAQIVGPMVNHLSGTATEALIMGAEAAQATIQSAIASSGVPGSAMAANATGAALNAIVQPITATATSAITAASDLAITGISQAAAAVIGGKAIQSGVRSAAARALPGTQIKALPPANPLTGTKTAQQLLEASDQSSIDDLTADALERAKAIATKFSQNYKLFQASLAKGDKAIIEAHSESLVEMADIAKAEVTEIVQTLEANGVDVSFGSSLGGKLNNVKGQLSRKQNLAVKQSSRALNDLRSPSLDRRFNEDGDTFNTRANRTGATPEQLERLKELDRLLREIEKNTDRADAAMEELEARSTKTLNDSFEGLNEQIERFGRALDDPTQAVKDLESSIPGLQLIPEWVRSLAGGLAALGGLSAINAIAGEFIQSSLDAAINFERLENTFKFVTGSASAAADQIARIREEANTIGTDATQGLEGFAQLASATRGSSLEGAATEQLSTAIQQAAAVSQLDSESLDRANAAISQIAGKGKLSAEELRQQLAEVGGVFSGSFQIAARAIGVTTAELDKMLERGEILSEDFLPKFAQQLAAETAAGVAGAADTARASINRINNQMVELRESFGAPLVEARTSALNVGADLLEKLVDLAPIASSLLTGLIAKLSIDAGSGLIQSLGGIQSLIGGDGLSFGDVDLDTGRGTTFGDRVVDGGLDLLGSDVTVLAESAKTKLSEAFMTAKTSVTTASIEMSKALALPTLSLDSIKVSAISMAKTTTAQFTQISVASIRSAATMAKTMTVGFLNVSKAALAMGASLVKAIAPIIAISAAFESISVARRALALDDLAGEVGGFAEQAEQGFAAYQAAVAKATGANNEFIASLPSNRSDVGGDNLFTGSLVENLLGQGGAENLDKILTRFVSLSGVGVAARALGRDGIRSVAERQAEQAAIARDELFQQANQTISASFESDVQSALAQVNDFDQQLSRLRSQRRGAVDPSEREAIGQSIDDLLQRREQQFGVVGSLQGELARERELIQKTIDDLQERATQAQPGITQDTYNRQIAVAESLLSDIAERQDYLTNSIENSVDAAVLLTREFTALNAQFEDAQLALNIENAQGQLEAAIASQGMGQQAIEQITGQADIQRIRSQIELNTQKRDEIIALLNDQDIANAFEDFADRGITRDLGAAEILDRLEGEGDSTAVNNLRQFAENSIQLDQLQAETIQLDADLVNAQNNLQQQARDLAMQYRDLSQQISDFYRDALRSAEDVASQIVSQDFQNATQEISNEIRRELLGLEDSFVSGIGETFTGLIQSLRQPLLDELNAISERNNVTRQFEDALRSGQDLQRQADEFDFNAGLGPDPVAGLPTPQALGQSISDNFITTADGRRFPRVIDLTAEQAFGGGSFLGEPSSANTSTSPTFTQAQPTPTTFSQPPQTAIRNDDIRAANALAQRSRDEQLASIDRNLAAQASTASVEAETAIAAIARQLEEGRRTITEQSTSFTRSLRSIGEGIGEANPLRELESGLLAVSDQFEDTNRDLDQFKRGLQDTIAETATVRNELLQGVAAGTIGQDALAILPDLDRTIAESQAALQRADGQIDQNRQLLEAQRRQLISDFQEAERDRRRTAQRRIVEGRGEIDSARLERPIRGFDLGQQRAQELAQFSNDAAQQAIAIGFEFDTSSRELTDLAKAGEITKAEFAELRGNLIELNEIRLDNLKRQFEDLLPTVDAIASSLGQASGEINAEAFTQIAQNIEIARQAGAITSEQAREARSGLSRAESIGEQSDVNAIRALIREENPFVAQFLSQAGRGDLVGLADLGIQNRQADAARDATAGILTNPQALANELTRPAFAQPSIDPTGAFTESSNKLVGALDRLTTAITENSGGGDVIIQRQNNTFSRDEESIERKAKKMLEQALNSRI